MPHGHAARLAMLGLWHIRAHALFHDDSFTLPREDPQHELSDACGSVVRTVKRQLSLRVKEFKSIMETI